MRRKDFFHDTAMTFFIIVTCANLAIYVLGTTLRRDMTLTYDAFLSPIIYGICGSIPNLIMYSKHELSVKEIIIRKVLQIIVLEAILVYVAFGSIDAARTEMEIILPFCIAVFVVYVAVHVFLWLIDLRAARIMTLQLEKFQKNCE